MSYAGAQTVAAQASFLAGDRYAYMAEILAVLIGMALVYRKFPQIEDERQALAEYAAEDSAPAR